MPDTPSSRSTTLQPGQLVEILEAGALRHGIIVSTIKPAWPVLYVPATGRRDLLGYGQDVREGVEPWFPAAEAVRPRRARGPWDDTLRAAYEADPWDLRRYEGSPRQARARAAKETA